MAETYQQRADFHRGEAETAGALAMWFEKAVRAIPTNRNCILTISFAKVSRPPETR